MDEAAAIAEAAVPELRFAERGHRARRGEGMIRPPAAVRLFLAAYFAKQFHRAADRGDVPVLGDDEGDQHFPRALPEDADALFLLRRGPEEGIARRVDPSADRAVVLRQVEIAAPDGLEFRLAAGEGIGGFPKAFHVKAQLAVQDAIAPVRQTFPAKALSAVGDPVQIEVVGYL